MAIMIPDVPRNFETASLEDVMFKALELLPNDYYVFHSFKMGNVVDNTFYESETDFLIFNKNYGIICLEAKAGQIQYKNGSWYYGSGEEMKHGGPFEQASMNKWKLLKYIKRTKVSDIASKCKFLHAVWFPSISRNRLNSFVLPSDCDKNLIMTKEDLENPEITIRKIFSIELPNKKCTDLSDSDAQRLIKNVLCPQFNVFPTASFELDLKRIVFHRLLNEQTAILNFLIEQRSAVINGAAGTGKTVIAVEKARRHAEEGEKVLFLCYNKELRNYLDSNYKHDNIKFSTINGFACECCGTKTADFNKLRDFLDEAYLSSSFEYNHVIIDEGQDFGFENIEEADIIQSLKDIISETEHGTFYIFYDKLQLIQTKDIPEYIKDADCKMTLYRNCRNTENIAVTSLKPVTGRAPLLRADSIKGLPAKFHFCDNDDLIVPCIDKLIVSLENNNMRDIVVLTAKTETCSVVSHYIHNGLYKNKYKFSTCRKFKGLEADAVILIDVDDTTFNDKNVLIYYVGTSRARLKLDIVTTLSNEECKNILVNTLGKQETVKKPKKELARALNAQSTLVSADELVNV